MRELSSDIRRPGDLLPVHEVHLLVLGSRDGRRGQGLSGPFMGSQASMDILNVIVEEVHRLFSTYVDGRLPGYLNES